MKNSAPYRVWTATVEELGNFQAATVPFAPARSVRPDQLEPITATSTPPFPLLGRRSVNMTANLVLASAVR
jgi:hypothetical protein